MLFVAELRHETGSTPRHRHGVRLLAALLVWSLAGAAQAVQQSPVPRWPEIKSVLLGDRTVTDGTGLLSLETPVRALDAAVVPVDIATRFDQTRGRHISKLYLIIDNNPSPLAAVFEFPGDRNWKTISTRVRVNAYTDVRVVAELNNGENYMVKNFVKASGGCSAPALKDPAAAAAQLGRMKLVVPQEGTADDLLLARLLVRHPNSSGLQFDQVTRNFIPADYVRSIEVRYNDQPLYKVTTDISISENPSIAFGFAPDADAGELDVQVVDTEGRRFEKRFQLAPTR